MIYPYIVFKAKANDHSFWASKSLCLRGCAGQGDTEEEAIKQLEIAEQMWMETAKEYGIPIPDAVILNLDKEHDLYYMVTNIKSLFDGKDCKEHVLNDIKRIKEDKEKENE